MADNSEPNGHRLNDRANQRRDMRSREIDMPPLRAGLLNELCALLPRPPEQLRLAEDRVQIAIGMGRYFYQRDNPSSRAASKDARIKVAVLAEKLSAALDALPDDALHELASSLGLHWNLSASDQNLHVGLDHLAVMVEDLGKVAINASNARLPSGPKAERALTQVVSSLFDVYRDLSPSHQPTHNPKDQIVEGARYREERIGSSSFDRFVRLIVDEIKPGIGSNTLNKVVAKTLRDRKGNIISARNSINSV